MGKNKKTETWVGIFLLLGIILIAGGVIFLNELKSPNKSRYEIHLIYKDAAGLIKGSNIRLGGANIGVVSSPPKLNEAGTDVILSAKIDNNIHLQRGSEFRIDMQNLLGDKFIDIIPPQRPTDDYILPGEYVRGHSDSDLTTIRENAVKVSTELVHLLKKLDENSDGLVSTINDISDAAQELSEATRRINKGILNDRNLKNLELILANVEHGTKEVPEVMNEAKSSLAEFKATLSDARGFIADANSKLQMLDEGIAQIGPTLQSFKASANSVSSIAGDLNSGKGTMGLLLKDAKFRKDFEIFIRNLRDYGILRYRNPNEPEPLVDPRAGYTGSRR